MALADGQTTIEIRLAAVDEAPFLESLLRQSFLEYEALYTPEAFAATTPSATQIRSRWAEGPVWLALRAGERVGTVAAVPRGASLHVRSMGIVPSARGRGIGVLLLEQVEQFARLRGFERMDLSTTPFLLQAIRRYERFGFVRTAAGPHELWGTPLFTMEKSLSAG